MAHRNTKAGSILVVNEVDCVAAPSRHLSLPQEERVSTPECKQACDKPTGGRHGSLDPESEACVVAMIEAGEADSESKPGFSNR